VWTSFPSLGSRAARRAGLLVLLTAPCFAAGRHEQGNVALSIGGSFAQTHTYDRISDTELESLGDDARLTAQTQVKAKGKDYQDVDASLYLSAGYFLLNRLEVGLSGSAMTTHYSGTTLDDFGIYDGSVYGRYFFDNRTSLTPYVKLAGGYSWLESGDYQEVNTTATGVLGLEFLSFGPVTWYAEFSSQYKELGEDLSGSEWKNQIYIGMSVYFSTRKKREAVTPASPEAKPDSPSAPSAATKSP
jgi:hypothetical protein